MLRVSIIGIILLLGVLTASLVVYFRSKRKAKGDINLGAGEPGILSPPSEELRYSGVNPCGEIPLSGPWQIGGDRPTGTAEAVAAAVSLARADHVHPRSDLVPPSPMFLYHQSRSINGVPVDPGTTLDQTMQQFDAMMQSLGTNMGENINRIMGNLNRSMGNLTHYYEDFAALQAAGVRPEQLRGDTRNECLMNLREETLTHTQPWDFSRMFTWRDHDRLPDWPQVMRGLLRNQAGTPRATQQPAQTKPAEPEKPSEPPLRFERDDVI